MLISNKQKWMFIHIPKTGGSSIVSHLWRHADVEGVVNGCDSGEDQFRWRNINKDIHQHASLRDTINILGDHVQGYFKFCVVRNTWDLLVSLWCYWHKLSKYPDPFRHAVNVVNNHDTFKSYVSNCKVDLQLDAIRSADSQVDMDYIARFDHLDEDVKFIFDKINLPINKLPVINITKHAHYSTFYDDETVGIVNRRWCEDINYFNFKFDYNNE